MDVEESAILKQYAARTLHNLLSVWDDVDSSTQIGKSLHLPAWSTLDDITRLLAHVYWMPTLAEIFRNNEENSQNEEG